MAWQTRIRLRRIYWLPRESVTGSVAQTLADFTPTATGSSVFTDPYVVTSGGAAVADRSPSITFSGYTPLENDVVVMFPSSTTTATITIPSGWWNVLGGTTDVESDAHQICAVYHKVTAAEQASVTTTYTATNLYDATETGYVQGAVIRNVDPNDVVDNAGSASDTANTVTPHVLAAITGTGSLLKDGSLVISSVAKDGTGDYGASAPTGWTRLRNDNTNQGRWIGRRDALTTANTNVTATNITPSAGDEYASISVAFTKAGVSGTHASTLADFTSSASGGETFTGTGTPTLENATSAASGWTTVTGTSAQTLEHFTGSASGSVGDVITGTGTPSLADATSTASGTEIFTGTSAQTLANFTSTASGTETITGTSAQTLANFVGLGVYATFPASISGRKILDNAGNVYFLRSFSSWGMASLLSDADIETALDGVAANGFNGVTVWMGGTEVFDPDWHQYENAAAQDFWTGTPWASTLGAAWASVDHVVEQAEARGLTVSFSFCSGWTTGSPGGDWAGVTNTDMYNVGVAVATRYQGFSNIVWHIMFDANEGPGGTRGTRIQNLFDGINDTESPARPVRWLEVDNGFSTNERGWLNNGNFNCPINGIYEYTNSSVEAVEAGYSEVTTVPFGDVEPPYDESPHYSGDEGQQLRERSYAVAIEGGCLINYGHEDWWHFTATGIYGAGDWTDVPAHNHTVQQSYVWSLVDDYMLHTDWDRSTTFVTTGEGSGDTKAAQGARGVAAIAYFPSSRTIEVDTTIITGTGKVRLRWYDPTDGTYDVIAASESQQTGRSITYPSAHADTTNDWVLVVDLDPSDGTAAVTLANFTSSASGTVGQVITGTASSTLADFSSTATGTEVFTGTSAQTLAAFTSTASGAEVFTGTSAQTLEHFTGAASGIVANPVSGTVAVTLADVTGAASGAETISGTSAQTLADATSTASGIETISGTVAVALEAFTSSVTASVVFTGTSAQTLADFTGASSGTESMVGTAAATLEHFTSTASGSITNPGSNGAAVLDDFTSNATGAMGHVGTAAPALANFTSTASGTEQIIGTSAQILADVTSAASGTETITGTGSTTLADATSSASGTETITGTAASTLAAFTSAASGTPIYTGTSATALQDIIPAGSGIVAFGGFSAQTLANFTSTASGNVGTNSSAAVTLADATSSAAGSVILNVTGTCAVTLQNFTCFAFQQALALSPFTIIETIYVDFDPEETIYVHLIL